MDKRSSTMANYSIEFKAQLIREYKKGEIGFKALAKKYNITRDTVRGIIRSYLPKQNNKRLAEIPTVLDMKEKEDDKVFSKSDKDFDYYKTAALYWQEYAKLLEKEVKENRKKKLKIQAISKVANINNISICKACEIAKIPRSSFYFNRNNNLKEKSDAEVMALIARLPETSRKRAGSKTKAKMIYQQFGITINHKRIARICKEYGLLARNRLKKHPKDYYVNKEEERKNLPKNELNREFSANEPFKKMCTDVSYFKTQSGWLYLSPTMDLYNRKIIAYSISKNNDNNLVSDMFRKLENFKLKGAMIHSDQGVLYTSKDYRKKLKDNKIKQSMSRRANCWDNACIEHFFGILKVESGYNEILKKKVLSFNETKKLIENYIEYYNNKRIQKNLGWHTPSSFCG